MKLQLTDDQIKEIRSGNDSVKLEPEQCEEAFDYYLVEALREDVVEEFWNYIDVELDNEFEEGKDEIKEKVHEAITLKDEAIDSLVEKIINGSWRKMDIKMNIWESISNIAECESKDIMPDLASEAVREALKKVNRTN